ncbi:MAG: hypothetical protein QXX87_05750 [Candidatus Jordarchaeales archaeon]
MKGWREWYEFLVRVLEELGVDKATARIAVSMMGEVKPNASLGEVAEFLSRKVEELSKVKIPAWVIEDALKRIPRW